MMFPGFSASGYVGLGGNDHRWNAFNTYSLAGGLTKITGPHTLKFGHDGRLTRVNVREARASGSFSLFGGHDPGAESDPVEFHGRQ
jgi:hypothetical protein